MARPTERGTAAETLYELAGLTIAVRDPERVLVGRLRRLYAHAERPVDGLLPDLRVEVDTDCRRPTEPPDRPILHIVLDRPLRGFLLHGCLWLSDGRNAAWVDYDTREVRLDVATRDEAALYVLAHHMFPIALGELLRTRGRYALHAAALETSAGRGLLVLGASDAGKSTLCYRALALGARCVADDGVVLHASGDATVASPFYREPCLDPALLRPEDRARAQAIEPSRTGPRHRIELDAAAWTDRCTVDAIWLLERSPDATSTLVAASPSDVLAELARQNRRLLLHPALAEAHLAFLGRLVGAASGWVARVGSGILTSDRALEELLSR